MSTEVFFGRDSDGNDVPLYSLADSRGLVARITSYGATLVSLQVPDRHGARADVVLGFDALADYLGSHPYFGCVVGRYANRIAHGRFSLDGCEYQLACNNGRNHLHGGASGFNRRLWSVVSAGDQRLALEYLSPDGEEGYPGNLHVRVTYSLLAERGASNLTIDYEAQCDASTIVNLTNHAYFNLVGEGTTLAHELRIDASRFLPVDASLIPTGELRPVDGSPMDFRVARRIGERLGDNDEQLRLAGGYDHNWVLDVRADTPVAELREPVSGRTMEVFTTQPGLQFYDAHLLDGSLQGEGGRRYGAHSGVCLETQHFPDSPNQPAFPPVTLRPGSTYRETTRYRFSCA